MTRLAALAVLAVAITGCASSSSGLPYKPAQPPSGASVSADYTVLIDRLRVEVDTGRHRLENAEIIKPDGTTIRAQSIEHAPLRSLNQLSVGHLGRRTQDASLGPARATGCLGQEQAGDVGEAARADHCHDLRGRTELAIKTVELYRKGAI